MRLLPVKLPLVAIGPQCESPVSEESGLYDIFDWPQDAPVELSVAVLSANDE